MPKKKKNLQQWVTENAIKKSKTQGLKGRSGWVLVLGWVSMEKLYKQVFVEQKDVFERENQVAKAYKYLSSHFQRFRTIKNSRGKHCQVTSLLTASTNTPG